MDVLDRPLRYLAIALSLIIALSFTLFALEDIGRASKASEHRIAGLSLIHISEPTRPY